MVIVAGRLEKLFLQGNWIILKRQHKNNVNYKDLFSLHDVYFVELWRINSPFLVYINRSQ